MAEASHHRQGLSCRYICGEMIMSIADRYLTHAVENQAPPLQDYNSYLTDIALREAVAREGGGWSEAHLSEFGAVTGGEMVALGYAANERSEEHTSELQSLMRISYAVFCLKKKKKNK